MHFCSVFVLPVFEVNKDQSLPGTKAELLDLFHRELAVWFHFEVCAHCHMIPNATEWVKPSNESEMRVFISSQKTKAFNRWEPFFVGTNDEPIYDERLSWEGKRDKIMHAYIMCLFSYKFSILSNGFLVHKAGIKHESVRFEEAENSNNELIKSGYYKKIKASPKKRKKCDICVASWCRKEVL